MKYYVVDAFTDEVFHGNQAGVCLLDSEISDEVMQNIASQQLHYQHPQTRNNLECPSMVHG